MKKIPLIISLVSIGIAGIFTSCDEDYSGPDPVDVTANYSNKFTNPNPNLILLYNGESIAGKSIDFSTVKGKTASITLYDILPGENTLKLTNIPLYGDEEGYTFKGSGTAASTLSTFDYEGRVVNGKLTLSLTNVMMGNAGTWADTYRFAEVSIGKKEVIIVDYILNDEKGEWEAVYSWGEEDDKLLTSACYTYTKPELSEDGQMAIELSGIFKAALGYILPQLLQNITLEADGNILADYSTDPLLGFDFSPEHMEESLGTIFGFIGGILTKEMVDATTSPEVRSYTPSPKGLAYWYQKDGQLVVKPNLPNIISQVAKSSGKNIDPLLLQTITDAILQMDALKLKALLTTINEKLDNDILGILTNINDISFKGFFNWVATGIPMNVTVKDGHTLIYLDKEGITPLFKLFPDLLPLIDNLIPADMQMRELIIGIVEQILTEWPEYCLEAPNFDFGLDLIETNR